MEWKAEAERYHRYNEPDPEMDDGGYRTPHKHIFATIYPEFFSAPCRKSCVLGRKMIGTFFNDLNAFYHHAKFGGDRTTRAGCRCENMMFVFCLSRSEFDGPFVRAE